MIFGWGNIVGAPIGGILSDKFNHKTMYICGLMGTSLLSILLAYNLNYDFALFVFAGFAVTGLFLLFPAHIKVVRLLTDENNQGKVFGFAEAFAGLGSVIVNTIALSVFAWYVDEVFGFKAVLIFFGLCGIASSAVLDFLADGPAKLKEKGTIDKAKAPITLSDFFVVLRCPGTWFAGIAVFSTTPCTAPSPTSRPIHNVLGVSVVFSGGLAIIRTYGIRFVMSPWAACWATSSAP
jgi:MFS family permease